MSFSGFGLQKHSYVYSKFPEPKCVFCFRVSVPICFLFVSYVYAYSAEKRAKAEEASPPPTLEAQQIGSGSLWLPEELVDIANSFGDNTSAASQTTRYSGS